MRSWKKITLSNFFTRLLSWEYWPFGIIQFPAILYWLWLSIRARSFVFFSACNPGIPMGGMFGESKYEILNKIPAAFIPATLLVHKGSQVSEVLDRIHIAKMKLPLILKPDLGERGYRVQKVTDEREIEQYVRTSPGSFLVQEWIAMPLEYGVFYMKIPGEENGKVISVVGKEMLSVTGDGRASLRDLILAKDRARLQWKRLSVLYQNKLAEIIPAEEKVELVSIGNHARGTRFIDANHLINDRLSRSFDRISREIPGFYFGRFDVRCESVEDLCNGKVKIMELNGCGAEAGHIYDENFTFWEALRVPVVYWNHIFRIARINKSRGADYASLQEAISYYRRFKSVVK